MRWMNLREFLRGGYQQIDDITVVANHGRPVFTVHPLVQPTSEQKNDAAAVEVATRPARGRTPER